MATLQKTTLCIFRSITLRRFLKERTLLAVKKRYHLLQFLHKQSLHMTHQRQCNEKMLSTLDIIKARIKAAGPLTVSEYMSIVLTNSVSGYYMKNDVFGKHGDFITSPEISQMFGELLAVWIVHEWSQLGSPTPIQLVELGPGRGTLADDILRSCVPVALEVSACNGVVTPALMSQLLQVFHQLKKVPDDALSLHLVEVSPKMSELQANKLTGRDQEDERSVETSGREKTMDYEVRGSPFKTTCSKTGVPVHWYDTLSKVPRGFSCFIAHEFLDALPVHKFQKTDAGWREVLVDIDDSSSPEALRFVLSAGATPASTVLIKKDEKRNHLEVSPQSGIVMQELSDRISTDGGMGLVVDYGHCGEKEDTLRAFQGHKLHNVLKDPGSADVTADVDFSYLKEVAGDQVVTFGPVPQGHFLQMLGIQTRLKMLLRQATSKQQSDLVSGYRMLVDPAEMGERFKMLAIFPQRKDDYRPAGFPP